ncbi:MAG: CopG family transcriptional regulator [Chloroflexi bacterium]|nr:CopG family transcriptional regulator [Chloroflexota bacterium]
MRARTAAKVTISLPHKLLELADALAQEQSVTRSEIIADLLRREEKARFDALMAEGYREMAEENLRMAEEAIELASEVMLRND